MRFIQRAAARRTAAGLALGLAATMTGAAVSGPAASAPDDQCPEVFPAADLVEGQAVDGLTVTRGTTPVPFEGEIIGTITDGIAPGVDMIMAELTSDEIGRVDGIWQGMSGSPVYSEDGRLIGAVAYGLSFGASPVAGLTPASEMYRLSASAPAPADVVPVPRAQRQAVRAAGATARQVESGFRSLPMPYGVSGLRPARLEKAVSALKLGAKGTYTTVGAAPVASAVPAAPAVPGGNLAASMSYGDVSYVGTGTVTAVCGEDVIGFGHPFNFSGATSLTMHNASAVLIQRETLGPPFKVANPSAPIGTIDQDRLAGIAGPMGDAPRVTPVTSTVAMRDGSRSRTGETRVSFKNALAEVTAMHLLANQDRVLDAVRSGSSGVGFTITGTRPDGRPFSVARTDHWSDQFDVTFAPVFDVLEAVAAVQRALGDRGSIDNVALSATLSEQRLTWGLAKAEVRRGKRWIPMTGKQPIMVRAGRTVRVRATLTSLDGALGTKVVRLPVVVPRTAAGTFGTLVVGTGRRVPGLPLPAASGLDGTLNRITAAPRSADLAAAVATSRRRQRFVGRTVRDQGAKVTGVKTLRVIVTR